MLAWWEGYVLPDRAPDPDPSAAGGQGGASGQPGSKGKHVNRSGKPLWTPTRVEVVEKIWGEGFATPGGNDQIPDLVRPLGLTPAMSVLDLGAGLGGATRVMAKKYGAWITGLEHNPVLTGAAMQRSQKAGLGRQAPIQDFDPEAFTWPRRVDCVFSKEMLFTVRNKDGALDGIEACLKPGGHLLFTDYVRISDGQPGRSFQAWLKSEPVEPHPWTPDAYVEGMKQRNLDVRIAEDVSPLHKRLVLEAIQNLAKHLETVEMDRDTKLTVIEEVELWARRVAVLDDVVRVYRFHALKPGEVMR